VRLLYLARYLHAYVLAVVDMVLSVVSMGSVYFLSDNRTGDFDQVKEDKIDYEAQWVYEYESFFYRTPPAV